jgi:hypothetical protein
MCDSQDGSHSALHSSPDAVQHRQIYLAYLFLLLVLLYIYSISLIFLTRV